MTLISDIQMADKITDLKYIFRTDRNNTGEKISVWPSVRKAVHPLSLPVDFSMFH